MGKKGCVWKGNLSVFYVLDFICWFKIVGLVWGEVWGIKFINMFCKRGND